MPQLPARAGFTISRPNYRVVPARFEVSWSMMNPTLSKNNV
jgi:hypothetical protein